MSLSADEKEHHWGPALKLHRENWNTWIAKVKDYILSLDHDEAADIWQAYEWVPGGAGGGEATTTATVTQRARTTETQLTRGPPLVRTERRAPPLAHAEHRRPTLGHSEISPEAPERKLEI